MAKDELEKEKYEICCPLCENYHCQKGTDKCEAEEWVKERTKNEHLLKDII